MSDVSFARAGWLGKVFFIACVFVLGATQLLPKITTRRRWAQLLDREAAYDLAVAKIEENHRLRENAEDAQADALRLHGDKMRFFEALLEMRCRDDKNGSLQKAYREIIDAALNQQQAEVK